EELGYRVAKMSLDATSFFVPQRRRRLFLIGVRGGDPVAPEPARFLDRLGVRGAARSRPVSAREALADLGAPVARGERAAYGAAAPSAYARLLRDPERATVSLHVSPRMSATDRALVAHIPPGGNYRDVPDAIATGRIKRFKETGGRTTTYGRLHPDRPSYTINTYFRRPNVGCNFHYEEPRLITPREAMRFQSLPDRFEIPEGGPQDARNALIGNAVPPLLARAIAGALRESLERGRARAPSPLASAPDTKR